MKRNEIIAVIAFIAATLGTIAGVLAIEGFRRNRLFTAELVARAPEYGNFYPQTLSVPAGEEVRLMIRNIDTVTHGFVVPDLGIAVPQIKAREVKVITFTADRPGTYPFMCTVWCSARHLEMGGRQVVK